MSENKFVPTPTSDRLYEELRKIYNDRDFIAHVFSCADKPEDWDLVLDFIERAPKVTSESVSLFVMSLGRYRK